MVNSSAIEITEKEKAEAVEWLHNIYLEQQHTIIKILYDEHTQKLVDILLDLGYLFLFETIFCGCMNLDKCKCKFGKTLEQIIATQFFIDYWKPK